MTAAEFATWSNACRTVSDLGCACERADCGGYTCHRREPIECTCGECPWAPEPENALTSYDDAWPVYKRFGWAGVLPLRKGTKYPPPKGFTGWDGHDPSGADCAELAQMPHYVGTTQTVLRMPSTLAGLDVDAYDGRTGAETIAEAERRWCPLTAGPWSSARDDGVSGIRFFQIPDGLILVSDLAFPELDLGHVEVIQRHHRFAVVQPSLHPKLGTPYRWRDGSGALMDGPPRIDEFPALPAGWCTMLAAGSDHRGERADAAEVEEFLAGLPVGAVCESVRAELRSAERDLNAPVTCRHDDMMRHVLALLRLGEQGHPGVPPALDVLRKLFIETVTEDGSRTAAHAAAEFTRMAEGERGIGLIKADPTPEDRRGCHFCGLPPDPERTRRALAGVVNKVLSAPADEREKLLRWSSRKIYDAVAEGQLAAESAASLVVSTATEVGLDDSVAQRIIAERLHRLGAGR